MKRLLPVIIHVGLSIFPLATSPASAETAVTQDQSGMREAFDMLSLGDRKRVQDAMLLLGHYAGAVDGTFGPATEAAIPLMAADLERMAAGEIRPPKFPLATRDEVSRLFDYIVSGQADIYLLGQ